MRMTLLNIAAASLLLGTAVTLAQAPPAQAPAARLRLLLARLRRPPVRMLSRSTW